MALPDAQTVEQVLRLRSIAIAFMRLPFTAQCEIARNLDVGEGLRGLPQHEARLLILRRIRDTDQIGALRRALEE